MSVRLRIEHFLFGNPNSLIHAFATVWGDSLAIATGDLPSTACAKECWWPHNDEWQLLKCPFTRGHADLHGDENWFPCFSDEDSTWFNAQRDLTLG